MEKEEEILLGKIKSQFEETLKAKGFLTKAELDAAVVEKMKAFEGLDAVKLKSLFDEKTGIFAILAAQGEDLTRLKAQGGNKPEDLSTKAQVARWAENSKAAIEDIKNGKQVNLPAMNLKVAITMTNGTSLGGSVYLPNAGVNPGIIDLVRTQPTFWSRLRKGSTKLNPFVWINKTNKQGNAAFIGEGVLKPLASFELSSESSTPKKVAERMKISTEMLNDVEGLASYIEQEVKFEVETAANTAVLTGVASSTSPAGVTTEASLFTQTGIEAGPNPSNADAIRAAIAQLQVLNFSNNITAFVNPVDAANMDLAKTSDGVYLLPPFTSADGRIVAGVPVIVDNNIAIGYLLIGDFDKYKIYMHQDFFVNWGWENDDFSKNLITIIGEMRFHQFVSANHAGAFIYDTFANIKAAIVSA